MMTALLRDPFEELAERLLTIAQMRKWSGAVGGHPLLRHHEKLLSLLDGMDLYDEKSILRSFRTLSSEQHSALRSPMTSALGCFPEEEPQRRSVSIALDNLAKFDLVGTRDRLEEFWKMTDSLIGVPSVAGLQLEALPGVRDLAGFLRRIGLVSDLLDEDIALYSFASEAINEALGSWSGELPDFGPRSLERPREL
jgi:hypothetical protein